MLPPTSGCCRSVVHARGEDACTLLVRTPPCQTRKKVVISSGVRLGTPIRRQALRRLKERRITSLELLWDRQADLAVADEMVNRETIADVSRDAKRVDAPSCCPISPSLDRVGISSTNRENECPLISQAASTGGHIYFADADQNTYDSSTAQEGGVSDGGPDDVFKRMLSTDDADRNHGAAAAKHLRAQRCSRFLFRRYHGLFRQEETECS